MTGKSGMAETGQGQDGGVKVRLHIEPGHSIILRTFTKLEIQGEPWNRGAPGRDVMEVKEPWTVQFIDGGPVLPKAYESGPLGSWTRNGDPETGRFAGTALYRTTFDIDPGAADGISAPWLDLGSVKHSARVTLNGRALGTLIMAPYRVAIPQGLLKPAGNVLEIEVTNLSANRIRDLDRRKVPWRIFHDINLVNIHYKAFDASDWPVLDSGLLGPVKLREQTMRDRD